MASDLGNVPESPYTIARLRVDRTWAILPECGSLIGPFKICNRITVAGTPLQEVI